MVLAQIIRLALRQLDEDAAEAAQHEELFTIYANTGYQILLRRYVRPQTRLTLQTDGSGAADLNGLGAMRVLSVQNAQGREMGFTLSGDGERLLTPLCDEEVTLCVQEETPPLEPGDEPRLPEAIHAALADYICYRHLSSGSLAKQSRAKFFLTSFYQAMQRMRPAGTGSVTARKNLYEATRLHTVYPQ